MTELGLEEITATTVATLRRRVPTADLTEFFGDAFDRVAGAVARAGGGVAAPPFAWYHGMPSDTVDVSAGFPVLGDVHTPEGGVALHERPGGRAVVAIHVGPYDTISETYSALMDWLTARDLTPRPEMWEEYLTEPDGDPATWRTRLVVPVE
jgi:effector-binding domain-containing protein